MSSRLERPVRETCRVIHFAGDAVLFDLDGTLVDSSGSVLRSWHRVATALGIPFTAFEPYVHGIPAPDVFAAVAPDLSPDEVRELSERMLAEQAADIEGVAPAPGVPAVLGALPTSRWAIVTSGDRRLATTRIAAAGLPAPGVLVTAEDVRLGKPDPECYLLAAQRLGFAPERCLVVEDAPVGVRAGLAAGMAVLGVLMTYPELSAPMTVRDLSTVDIRLDRTGVRVLGR
jgi:sugar-phosphatase